MSLKFLLLIVLLNLGIGFLIYSTTHNLLMSIAIPLAIQFLDMMVLTVMKKNRQKQTSSTEEGNNERSQ